MNIGKLTRVPLRDVWKHEAYDFSAWVAQNIYVINEATGLNLSSVETEQPAGNFSVDLVAENSDGNMVIIENQLERSDHGHLGKLLTYLTAYSASAAIWIVSDARPEHTAAVNWLNLSTEVDFYLLQAEAIKIDDSPPALLLNKIVGPSNEIKTVGKNKKEISDREKLRELFHTDLLENASTKSKRHQNVKAGKAPWQAASSGTRGISFIYGVNRDSSSVFLYIDRGVDSEKENHLIFDSLYEQKDEIEKTLGTPLIWSQLENKRACVVSLPEFEGGYRNPSDQWKSIHDRLIDSMIQFDSCFSPRIKPAAEYAKTQLEITDQTLEQEVV